VSYSTDRSQPVKYDKIVEYAKAHLEALAFWKKYPGKARCLGISKFNSEFFNPNFYKDRPITSRNFLGIEYEDNREIGNPIFEDVLRFFMSTDIHNLTGLSVTDVLEMDFALYDILKSVYAEIDEPRKKVIANIQNQIQQDKSANATDTFNTRERLAYEQSRQRSRW